MWLNAQHSSAAALYHYRQQLLQARPRHLVIDQLFNPTQLQAVRAILQQPTLWQSQQHTYEALYVDASTWQQTPLTERFVQRDVWQRSNPLAEQPPHALALEFLLFLRGPAFMSWLSRLFKVELTDRNLSNPSMNTNYFRLGPDDFIKQHADDSPGREVCMLLYLNDDWQAGQGGELVFDGDISPRIEIAPLFNRCILFDPAAPGTEHWVNALISADPKQYRYNVTSWYWSE